MTPIIGLAILAIMKYLGEASLGLINGKQLYVPIPFLLNVPLKPFAVLNTFFNITDCDQWYLYKFSD
jgi:hypothetical protein